MFCSNLRCVFSKTNHSDRHKTLGSSCYAFDLDKVSLTIDHTTFPDWLWKVLIGDI